MKEEIKSNIAVAEPEIEQPPIPIIRNTPYKLKVSQKIYRGIKTMLDFLIALTALLILWPLFIIIAIAIKCDSKGPVFFKHKRIGANNKEFSCIKFRSMSVNANHNIAGYEYDDVNSYITKVGKFIRNTSLDELPQLFCMLTGKMSLIGYRPSQREETELNECRKMYNVYQIKPGITGWAQVNGRDILASHPKEKAKYDNYYLVHYSFLLDVKIFFKTIKVVLKGSNIQEGKIEDEQ